MRLLCRHPLALHYRQFTEEYTDELGRLIVDEANRIQFETGPAKDMNVAVICYNEAVY